MITKITMILTLALGLAQLSFTFWLWRRERTQGLHVSKLRLLVVACTTVAIAAFFALNFQNLLKADLPKEISATTETQKPDPSSACGGNLEICARIKAILSDIRSLEDTIRIKNDSINEASKSLAAQVASLEVKKDILIAERDSLRSIASPEVKDPEVKITADGNTINQAMILCIVLLITGFLALIFLDKNNISVREMFLGNKSDSQAQRERSKEMILQLDALARLIAEQEYDRGYELACEIKPKYLNKIDEIDWLYLKSFCAARLLGDHRRETTDSAKPLDDLEFESMMDATLKDLRLLLELAPNMAEAECLLGYLLALMGDFPESLERILAAEKTIDLKTAGFDITKSYVCLHLAMQHLANAENEKATALFDLVAAVASMKDKVPLVRLQSKLVLIKELIRRKEFGAAQAECEALRTSIEIPADFKQSVEITLDAILILIGFSSHQLSETLEKIQLFLDKWAPQGLPAPDDNVADEFLFQYFDESEMLVTQEMLAALYFKMACVSLELVVGTKNQAKLSPDQLAEIRIYLLQAIQYEPRHRELLACLALLYYLFIPSKREKAISWAEAALKMGVHDDMLIEIVEHYKTKEATKTKLLEHFMDLSLDYFTDRNRNVAIRTALVEEFSRFQQFKPLLTKLADMEVMRESSPTIHSLLLRADHLLGFSVAVTTELEADEASQLQAQATQYNALVAQLRLISEELGKIEINIFRELGKKIAI